MPVPVNLRFTVRVPIYAFCVFPIPPHLPAPRQGNHSSTSVLPNPKERLRRNEYVCLLTKPSWCCCAEQVMTLVQELQKFTVPRQLPLVLTGDLNSQQDSAVYEFLQRGHVMPSHQELQDDSQGILENAELRHNLNLRDSYTMLGKDFYSNFTGGFVGILDYIWHTAERLRVTRILEQIDHDTLTAYTALPSPQYSSDHIALMTEFELSLRP